jgi:GxxExxY protein
MNEDEVSNKIIGCAIKVHSELGPGLLESIYETCLVYELNELGLKVEQQKALPIKYKGIDLNTQLRIDVLVEDSVLIELKSVENISNLHVAQTLTYLKLSEKKLGLILNFNCTTMKQGIKRLINGQINN